MRSLRATIRGQVQGVGFRPHVYRLAGGFGVRGFVANTMRGVVVLAQGPRARAFLDRLRRDPPPHAAVRSFAVEAVKARRFLTFAIKPSRTRTGTGVDVLPDLALCSDCRRELFDPRDRRHNYAFTNCTQCGPRYTIIATLPYDRPRTTMAGFRMCKRCRVEFSSPADRRYHAQPIACPDCGPRLSAPLDAAVAALRDNRIVAIKSLGGFQLACDATSGKAVNRLRRRKTRPDKPLALMCASVAVARRFCRVSREAGRALASKAAPVVLMPKLAKPSLRIADSVAPGNGNLGVMLCYTPLHAVLFQRLRQLTGRPPVLVMTSANPKDDPITADEKELAGELPDVADSLLSHDRPIANRCDDSVVAAVPNSPLIMVRRARGYAPQPLDLAPVFHVKHPVLAVGGEYKNTFALASGSRVFLSPHIGTVATPRGEKFWLDTLARYRNWTGIEPRVLACDLHPDYASTRLAERMSRESGLPLVRVQHHVAHTLSVMVEHGISGPVLGLAFDGTGYGDDGAIWGCEFLLVDRHLKWQRVGHLGYMNLANAGAEVADPRRVARAYLAQAARKPLSRTGAGSPGAGKTSSLGRLFDAVAAITGVCERVSFDGQAPIAVEAASDPRENGDWYTPDLLNLSVSPALIRPEPLVARVSRETLSGADVAATTARFHNTLAVATVRLVDVLCGRYGTETVCLSGGSFQNNLLRRRVSLGCRRLGLSVFTNAAVPPNDGGVSLGQVAAASRFVPGR